MSVRRGEDAVTVTFRDRPSMRFDEVVFACHGDQVLPLLADPSDRERDVFSGFHDHDQHRLAAHGRVGAARAGTRPRVLELPAGRRRRCAADGDLRLESPPGADDPEQVLRDAQPGRRDRRAPGAAPVRLSPPALHRARRIRAQQRWGEVSGVNRTHYCGAYWLYGFHEDGLHSALRVAARARGRVVIDSGLFVGTLRHRRFTPVAHAFTYPLFMALLDIDRVPRVDARVAADELQPLELGQLSTIAIISAIRPARCGSGSPSTRRATGSSCPTAPSSC